MKKIFEFLKCRKSTVFTPSATLMATFFMCGAIVAAGVFTLISVFDSSLLNSLFEKSRDCVYGAFYDYGFWNSLLSISKYHIAIFILGFACFGAFAIPLVVAFRGFSLMSTVYMFYSAMGKKGLAIAFTVLGFQNIIALPCLLIVSSYAFNFSLSLLTYMVSGKATAKPNALVANISVTIGSIFALCLPSLFNMLIVPRILSLFM